MRIYQHTQLGWITMGALLVAMMIPILILQDEKATGLAIGTAGVLLLIGLCFGALQVRVDHDAVRCVFGIGVLRKRIPAIDIVSVEIVRNKWYYGFGIRFTPTGWMWNVSGLDAVMLTLKNGKRFRIGTDEPQKLARAISEMLDREKV
jgi:hypothetical protein